MAKRSLTLAFFVGLLLPFPVFAGSDMLGGSETGRRLQVDKVPFSVAVEALMRRVSERPFVLCDVALADKRVVSLRLEPWQLKLSVVRGVLGSYGYRVTDSEGVLYVCDGKDRSPQGGSSAPSVGSGGPAGVASVSSPGNAPVGSGAGFGVGSGNGLPRGAGNPLEPSAVAPAPARVRPEDSQLSGYRPDYVTPAALLETVRPLFEHVTFSLVQGGGQRPALFASGPIPEVARFEELVRYLDRPVQSVEVEAIVLEVTDGARSGFGVSLVLEQLGKGLGFNLGSMVEGNSLTFSGGSFDAVLSAVTGSSRVRVKSSPRLRGRSGEKLRLQVGDDVPVLGSVVENPSGSTSQSVVYRSSGAIFEVTPEVLGQRIGLQLHQELSAFAATETGVRGSPTLSTRALDTTVDVAPGDWVVIGGLTSDQSTAQRQSLLGLVPLGKVASSTRTELVLLVKARAVGLESGSSRLAANAGIGGDARN